LTFLLDTWWNFCFL